jgi:hypothetical protein
MMRPSNSIYKTSGLSPVNGYMREIIMGAYYHKGACQEYINRLAGGASHARPRASLH